MVEFIFIVDILLMFITSFINSKGLEVMDSRKIFVKYVTSSRFIMDLLPLLGLDYFIAMNQRLKLFGMFKITRVARLGKLIASLNLPQDIKAFFVLIKLTVYLLLWFHSMACGWYLTIYANKFTMDGDVSMRWIPPLDFNQNHEDS